MPIAANLDGARPCIDEHAGDNKAVFFDKPCAAIALIRAVQLCKNGKAIANCLAHSCDALACETRTILDGTTVLVGSPVEERTQELTKQIAMGNMNLDAIEAPTFRAGCCIGELRSDARKVSRRRFARHEPRCRVGHSRRSNDTNVGSSRRLDNANVGRNIMDSC